MARTNTCATTPTDRKARSPPTNEIFLFDGLAYGGDTPNRGQTHQNRRSSPASPVVPAATRQISTAVYDPHGRVKEATDIAGQVTKTTYTPLTGGPVTKVVHHQPAAVDQHRRPRPRPWPAAQGHQNPNSRVTEYSYDALGRNAGEIWLPGRSKTNLPSDPTTGYTYNLSKTSVSEEVTTRSLNAEGGFDLSSMPSSTRSAGPDRRRSRHTAADAS